MKTVFVNVIGPFIVISFGKHLRVQGFTSYQTRPYFVRIRPLNYQELSNMKRNKYYTVIQIIGYKTGAWCTYTVNVCKTLQHPYANWYGRDLMICGWFLDTHTEITARYNQSIEWLAEFHMSKAVRLSCQNYLLALFIDSRWPIDLCWINVKVNLMYYDRSPPIRIELQMSADNWNDTSQGEPVSLSLRC